MPTSLLSQDIAALCLILADGNVQKSIDSIFLEAEKKNQYLESNFGITSIDLRNSALMLLNLENMVPWLEEDFNYITMVELISTILLYTEAHFNDEGEHWFKDTEEQDHIEEGRKIRLVMGWPSSSIQSRIDIRNEMIRIFKQPHIIPLDQQEVDQLMIKLRAVYSDIFHLPEHEMQD